MTSREVFQVLQKTFSEKVNHHIKSSMIKTTIRVDVGRYVLVKVHLVEIQLGIIIQHSTKLLLHKTE